MKAILLSLSIIIATYGNGAAQQPSYPPFKISGQKSGTSHQSHATSNSIGRATLSATGLASMHDFALTSLWDTARLSFSYRCIFEGLGPALAYSPTVSDGQPCPAGGSAHSNFVRAIRIDLLGTDAQDYELYYSCVLAYHRQPTTLALPQVSQGSWCGHDINAGAPQEWIQSLTVSLVHR